MTSTVTTKTTTQWNFWQCRRNIWNVSHSIHWVSYKSSSNLESPGHQWHSSNLLLWILIYRSHSTMRFLCNTFFSFYRHENEISSGKRPVISSISWLVHPTQHWIPNWAFLLRLASIFIQWFWTLCMWVIGLDNCKDLGLEGLTSLEGTELVATWESIADPVDFWEPPLALSRLQWWPKEPEGLDM